MVEEDSSIGRVKQKIPLFKNVLDDAGMITLYEDVILIKHGGENVRAPFSYVRKIEKGRDLPLGKVEVGMVVFDQMGEKYDFTFNMSEQDFLTLKKVCGK